MIAPWRSADRDGAIAALADQCNPIADTLAVAIRAVAAGVSISIVRGEDARVVGARHLSAMRSYSRPLEVIGALAPLLGLPGTVISMIKMFRPLASTG